MWFSILQKRTFQGYPKKINQRYHIALNKVCSAKINFKKLVISTIICTSIISLIIFSYKYKKPVWKYAYIKDNWNKLDFTIVISSLIAKISYDHPYLSYIHGCETNSLRFNDYIMCVHWTITNPTRIINIIVVTWNPYINLAIIKLVQCYFKDFDLFLSEVSF